MPRRLTSTTIISHLSPQTLLGLHRFRCILIAGFCNQRHFADRLCGWNEDMIKFYAWCRLIVCGYCSFAAIHVLAYTYTHAVTEADAMLLHVYTLPASDFGWLQRSPWGSSTVKSTRASISPALRRILDFSHWQSPDFSYQLMHPCRASRLASS